MSLPNHNPAQSMWRPGDPPPAGFKVVQGDGIIPSRLSPISTAGPPRRKALEPIYAPSLANLPIPERRWLVPGWIPDRAVTLLGGDGGTGKSLIALQLMAACAIGGKWLGMDVKPCKTFALFCEDDEAEVHIRIDAIARHLGVDLGDLEGVGWSARSGKANVLMHFEQSGNGQPKLMPLWNELVAEVKDFGAQLVIIDTLADTFSGNENYRGQARAYVNQLRDLAQQIDGAVVLTAHPSVAGQNSGTGLSGSTAWNNSVRSRLYLTRPTESDADETERVLRRMKANYAGTGDEIRMRWEDGVLIAQNPPTGIFGKIEKDKAERAFLTGLQAAIDKGLFPSFKTAARDLYAPKLLAPWPQVKGFKVRDLERAMKACMADGRIEIALTEDRQSRQREYIRPAKGEQHGS